jgi:hypothetical protein
VTNQWLRQLVRCVASRLLLLLLQPGCCKCCQFIGWLPHLLLVLLLLCSCCGGWIISNEHAPGMALPAAVETLCLLQAAPLAAAILRQAPDTEGIR